MIKQKFINKHLLLLFLLTLNIAVVAQEDVTFKTYWKNGMRIESSDGNFKFKFGGRIQVDWASFFEDDGITNSIGKSPNGVEFRRARFYNSGQIYGNIKYKLQLDFAEGAPELKDAYIMLTKVPFADFLQIGRFKEPVGLNELTSSKYITFMERSLMSESEPSRNTGIMIGNAFIDERLSFRLGLFKDTDDSGKSTDTNDKYNITGRVFGLPLYQADANTILHLGMAYSYRKPNNNEYELSVAPEANMANDYLAVEFTDASTKQIFQSEALFICNSFAFESELIFGNIERTLPGSHNFRPRGYYGSISYFLTGESKQYSTDGELDRVSPNKNYDSTGGWGAWEIALRYSAIDFGDIESENKQLNNITLGLNWYLNPVTRFMFNYVHADVPNIGNANIIQTRFQIDF